MTPAVICISLMASLFLPACSQRSKAQIDAFESGRIAIAGCQERFHEQAQTYADCVHYLAQNSGAVSEQNDLAEWRALGALQGGWLAADQVGQQGDELAETAARELLRSALDMQARVVVKDDDLCSLLQVNCDTMKNRRKDLMQSKPASAGER